MSDLVYIASLVTHANGKTVTGTAGATIIQGSSVYLDTSSGKWKLADADALASSGNAGIGIAVTESFDGQPIIIATTGTLSGIGATQGVVYVVSFNAGKIAPQSDLLTADYVTVLGVGVSGGGIQLSIKASQFQRQ